MTQKHEPSPLEEQIAENLQRAYRQRAEEEVPDRFRDLLRMLKEQDQQTGSDKSRSGEPRNANR
ncbi:MAG: RNA polymerase subunit sigma-70 [Maritimibacter sp.]|nr:RNA polymerase subunit sigma-70 [Maritimibacter sp.]